MNGERNELWSVAHGGQTQTVNQRAVRTISDLLATTRQTPSYRWISHSRAWLLVRNTLWFRRLVAARSKPTINGHMPLNPTNVMALMYGPLLSEIMGLREESS